MDERYERRRVGTTHVDTHVVPWIQELGNGARTRHEAVWALESEEMVDFAFWQEIWLDDEWQPVVRLSWAEDSIVIEEYSKGQEEPIESVRWDEGFDTVEEAYDVALAKLYDEVHVAEQVRRYRNER